MLLPSHYNIKLTNYHDFLNHFELPEKMSFSEFKETAIISYDNSTGSLVTEFIDRVAKKNASDLRVVNKEDYLFALYTMFVTNREDFLQQFFEQHFAIKNIDDFFKFEYSKNIIDGKDINGKYKNTTSKLLKNLHFDVAYLTKKTKNNKVNEYLSFLYIIQMLVESAKIKHTLLIPMSYDAVMAQDYSRLFAILRGTSNRPSFFNPHTFGYLLEHVFTGKKVLTPVLDWSSYALGFVNSEWDEYVGIDVMHSVVDKTDSILQTSNKKYELYCEPSEKVLSSKEFIDKYNQHFDLVFFSPPYYTLEVYSEDTDSQSITQYPEYQDWLLGYWEQTVVGCYNALAQDGVFAFVISDFPGYNMSEDMLEIAKKYFYHNNTYQLFWNVFSVLDAEKMKENKGENLFVLSKTKTDTQHITKNKTTLF